MKLAGVFCILCLALVAFDQTPPETNRKSLYLRAEMPAVYTSYIRRGPRPPRSKDEGKRGVWVSLHNNLRVPIQLYASGDTGTVTPPEYAGGNRQASFFKNGSEVRACYDVEGIPKLIDRVTGTVVEMEIPFREQVPEPSPATSCLWFRERYGLFSLAPGDSVVFSVPEEFVISGRRIATRFVYDWEVDGNGYHLSTDPAHFVYFSLPQY